MCVAILQKRGAKALTEEQLINGWESNPDGGGFAYIDNEGAIQTYHSMDKDDFISVYHVAHDLYGADSPFIVHMRIATSGMVNIETCHPFTVNTDSGETVFAHNGIIHDCNPPKTDKTGRSDTMIFRDKILNILEDDWLDNVDATFILDHYIGWSKLVFLTTVPTLENEWYIINERSGSWNESEDTWFSNDSCEVKPYTAFTNKWSMDGWDTPRLPVTNDNDWVWADPPARLFDPEVIVAMEKDGDYQAIVDAVREYPGYVCQLCLCIETCCCDEVCCACYEMDYDCGCDVDDVLTIADFLSQEVG